MGNSVPSCKTFWMGSWTSMHVPLFIFQGFIRLTYLRWLASITDGSRGWIMWIALAIMTTESIVSLVPVVSDFFHTLHKWYDPSSDVYTEDDDTETSERLVPTKWAVWGIISSAILGTGIICFIFGASAIKPWASLIGFVLAALLSLLGLVQRPGLTLSRIPADA